MGEVVNAALYGRALVGGWTVCESRADTAACCRMHCLRWWLPIFLLPLPAASPFMMLLFIVTYAIRTKPCAYCSVIVIGLMLSTCAFYSVNPQMPYDLSRGMFKMQSSSSAAPPIAATSRTPAAWEQKEYSQDPDADSRGSETKAVAQQGERPPSSCWIDLTSAWPITQAAADRRDAGATKLGWWSAQTRRMFPTALRTRADEARAMQDHDRHAAPTSSWRAWRQQIWREGILIGFDGAGFRLKLFLD